MLAGHLGLDQLAEATAGKGSLAALAEGHKCQPSAINRIRENPAYAQIQQRAPKTRERKAQL